MATARGGVGSNQYGRRGVSVAASGSASRVLPLAPSVPTRRCGEVWGTKCKTWVYGPDWSHGKHPSEGSVMHILYSPGVSPDVRLNALNILASNDDDSIRVRVATHTDTPPEILAKLIEDEYGEVRRAAAMNPNTPVHALLSGPEDHHLMAGLARNPRTSPEVLTDIARLGICSRGLIENPSTPPEALALLVSDDNSHQDKLAQSPRTPPEALARLAESSDMDTCLSAARNPNTPPETLAKLALSHSFDVRKAVGGNPSTPVDALIGLAVLDTVGAIVSPAVWKNPSLSETAKAQIKACHNDLTDPDTKAERIVQLLDSRYEWMRELAARHPQAPPDRLIALADSSESSYSTLRNVAKNPSAPPAALLKLATSAPMVRLDVAKNPNTPPMVLETLAGREKEDPAILRAVALHPNAPPQMLIKMAGQPILAGSVGRNPSAPPEALVRIAKTIGPGDGYLLKRPDMPSEALEIMLASGATSDDRWVIAGHPNATPKILKRLSESKVPMVREAVAQNPNTPTDLLLNLAVDDPAGSVRRAARNNLPEHLQAMLALGEDTWGANP